MTAPIYVADTHALLWYLAASSRLSGNAKRVFDRAASRQAEIIVPAIVLAELLWIIQKGSLDVQSKQVLATIQKHYTVTPLVPMDVYRLPELSLVPEMHDRLIVAEARRRNAVLITRDAAITRSELVSVLW
jgi:PIN domain nuclease of toxin-antitoxin system